MSYDVENEIVLPGEEHRRDLPGTQAHRLRRSASQLYIAATKYPITKPEAKP